MYFNIFIFLLVAQRLSELLLSKKNERWLLSQGAIEYGKAHYPWMIALHSAFILSLVIEYYLRNDKYLSVLFLLVFIVLLGFKYWILKSLGPYWSTRVFRIPGAEPVKKGPYRIFKHPNYVDVVFEIAIIPLVFHLYVTAIVFSVLNAVMLGVRIKIENRVWAPE